MVALVCLQIMRRATTATCEEVVVGSGGLKPLVALFDHPVVPLLYKAHAAGEVDATSGGLRAAPAAVARCITAVCVLDA